MTNPGNDDLTKEFFETFWSEVKKTKILAFYTLLIKGNSVRHKGKQLLNESKKRQDKRLILNWRPIAFLNVDVKIISEALSKLLKNVLPSLISDN